MIFLLITWRTAIPWTSGKSARKFCIRTVIKMQQWYHHLKKNKGIAHILQKRLMDKCCDDRRIIVFSLGQIWRWDNSSFLHGYLRWGHAPTLTEMRQCEETEIPVGAVMLGLGCDLTRVKIEKTNSETGKTQVFLETVFQKTFHSLKQARYVTRAGEERRVPGAGSCPSAAGEGLLSGSWHQGKPPYEPPLKLCRRHAITHPGWQVPVVLPTHISNLSYHCWRGFLLPQDF